MPIAYILYFKASRNPQRQQIDWIALVKTVPGIKITRLNEKSCEVVCPDEQAIKDLQRQYPGLQTTTRKMRRSA